MSSSERVTVQNVPFRCNVCGRANVAPAEKLDREIPSCETCGSTVRLRSIVHVLSLELFGESLAIGEFPRRFDLRGLGMSDRREIADRLEKRLGYRNTFLHARPRLDILRPDPGLLGSLDFLISSDVFEHVPPPVSVAFDNARRLLKPGGVFVFSAPYRLEGGTVEHFPDLHDYRIEKRGTDRVLVNRTRSGDEQVFTGLMFHGGPGATLEMRVFSRDDLLRHFTDAGFEPARIHGEDVPRYGVIQSTSWSLVMAARRAAGRIG